MTTEVLSYIPDPRGKKILELVSAHSKFTESLAKTASHVTSVCLRQEDFLIAQEKHKHLTNVTFMCTHINKLSFPNNSFDLVLSDTFFRDVDEQDFSQALKNILNWLSPGGHYFSLEPSASLNPIPGKRGDMFVPRTHTQCCHKLLTTFTDDAAFKVYRGKNMLTHHDESGRQNLVSFVAERIERKPGDDHELIMDIRYSQSFIFKLEWIFGHTWVSTGGENTTRDFCGHFNLRQNQRVLDAGCGTGGSAFFMARHYGVHVHGVDISTNMINIAIERLGQSEARVRNKIQFEIQDIVEADYEDNSYDVIYSRDVILHIHEKAKLFQKLYRWLRPGGLLFITDYCKGPGEATQDYLEYERKACSDFVTVSSYGSSLRAAGFKDVKEEDLADRFYGIQKEEQDAFLPTKESFVREYSQKEFDDLAKICANKLVWVKNGQFTWGSFMATK